MKAPRISGLDALRGLCALAVFAFHELYLFPKNGTATWGQTLPAITQYGYLGVPVFFMISGYVISWSADGKTRTQFLKGRFLRLMPTYWLCLVLTVAVVGASWNQIAANIFIAAPALGQPYLDAVYWSLVVEIIFYSAVFLIIGDGFKTRLRWLAIGWMIVSVIDFIFDLPADALLNPLWGPYFAVGIFVYLKDRLLVPAILLSGSSAYFYAVGKPQIPEVAAVLVMMAAIAMPFASRWRIPGLWGKAAVTAGAMSYPLYLFHAEAGTALITDYGPWMAVVVIFVSYLITLAEKTLHRFK